MHTPSSTGLADMLPRATPLARGYQYLPRIIEQLKTLHPWKIILFGSHAYGTPDDDSDIDLLVILNSEEIPQSFQAKMQQKLTVRKAIWDVSKQVAIDLLVYTRPMYRKFQELDSMFAREILQHGRILYETDNP